MSLRARHQGGSAIRGPNLTPLLDVVLQLITFFMMLIHFGTKVEGETQAIRLPVTSAAMPTGDLALDRLTVAMDSSGKLIVDGEDQPLDQAEAAKFWVVQAKARKKGLATLKDFHAGPADLLPTIVVVRAETTLYRHPHHC